MRLLNGYVLIRVDDTSNKTDSGIFLQEKTVKLPSTGVVEGVADEVVLVKVGDKVEFLRYATIDGTEPDTRFCKEIHILAVVDGKTSA